MLNHKTHLICLMIFNKLSIIQLIQFNSILVNWTWWSFDKNYRAPSQCGANQGLLEEFDIWCTVSSSWF